MKNLKKLHRGDLKSINGGAVCNENCPPGPYGPNFPSSCEAFHALPQCCKTRVLVHADCFPQ
ncbi:hypothetical protein AB4Y90_08380 [Chryseobacterium sp. 2TAF14]|jgi:hypothetical protein|uniref:bacteriocin-like protein n=1 Tax=Chryseobacterium sp. 2TAF14 TaxID=3233007 RepID=UPI003F8E69CE